MNTIKSIIAILATATILLCSIPFAASAKTTYKEGDLIQFGTYPQSRVDETDGLKAAAEAATWRSYDYYIGIEEEDDLTLLGDWMQFADFFFSGAKYRAVTFTRYRPPTTTYPSSYDQCTQYKNGYTTSNVYYFKYEPLVWRVLDPEVGLILCESIIDSQAFLNDRNVNTNENESLYENSSIRAWLNYDFYETAFSDAQKGNIENTFLIDEYPSYNYEAKTVSKVFTSIDKIFLLSYYEKLGFPQFNSAVSTDYALCQGVKMQNNDNSVWWTRSSIPLWGALVLVNNDSQDTYYSYYYNDNQLSSPTTTIVGVRPACCLRDLKKNPATSEKLFSKETTNPSSSQQIPQPSSDFVVLPVYYIPRLQGGAYYSESPTITIQPASINANGVTTTYSRIQGLLVDKSAIPAVKTVKLIAYKYTYDGKRKTPGVIVRDAKGNTLEKGKDYTLKYSKGRKAIGEYQVTVNFIGNYTGSKTLKFTIIPDKVTGLKATAAKAAAKLTWEPVKGATYYDVYYSAAKDGSYKKALSTKNTTATIKKLTSGKTYYFRTSAVTKLGSGTIIKGSVSATKIAKIK